MVFEQIKKIIVEAMGSRLRIDADDINMDTEVVGDLHVDSVDLANIVISIEDEFELEIEDEQIEKIRTIGDIVEQIELLQ